MNRKFEETKTLYGVDPVQLANLPYWKSLEIMKLSIKKEMASLVDEMKSITYEPCNYEKHSGLSRELSKKKKALILIKQKIEEIEGIERIDYA